MRKLIIAAAIACSFSAPAMAACHGHLIDGKWISNFQSWSDSEKNEMLGVANALKHHPLNLPANWFDPSELAKGIDRLECGGVSHEKAIEITVHQLALATDAARGEPEAGPPHQKRDGPVGFVEFAKSANDYCHLSSDRHQKLAKWVNATIVENQLRMVDVDVWWSEHPEEGNFLGKANNGDANARKVICDTLERALDMNDIDFPFPLIGYSKRVGVTCASGYRRGKAVEDTWCERAE